MDSGILDYKPSAWYLRKALRGAKSRKDAQEAGLLAVSELEALKAWVREQGLTPPKRFVPFAEAEQKGWLEGSRPAGDLGW